MMEVIKEFDYFGFTPQFFISGKRHFQSKFGGVVFILFNLLSFYYVAIQLIIYIKNRSTVDSLQDVIQYSQSYNITTKELYFGIGFINQKNVEFNLSEFSNFDIYMIVTNIDLNGTRIDIRINLDSCDLSYFLTDDAKYKYTPDNIIILKEKLKYYLCPSEDFRMQFDPFVFGGKQNFLQINFDFKNNSNLSQIQYEINHKRPRLNYIFKNLLVNTENKTHPYEAIIDNYWSEIDFGASKKIELSLNAYNLLDDDNIFGTEVFESFQSNNSQLPDDTILQFSLKDFQIGFYDNRTENLVFNSNKPFLNFFKIKITLDRSLRSTHRSYKKFATLLAELSSVLSNTLIILSIIMLKYNYVQGKNKMIKTMFTHTLIKNLKLFKDDLKPIFQKGKSIKYQKRFAINNENLIKSIANNFARSQILGESIFLYI